MRKFLLTIPLLLFSCGTPVVAQQQNCAPRDSVVEGLQNRYSEYQRMLASSNDYLVEFFGSDETGTWTIILTHPNGMSCLVSSGTGYVIVEPQALGEDS